MEAAESLAAAPAAVALPALERALGDTSAQVRAASVKALARIGGEHATALVRRAWSADTSYDVRGQAVAALAKLDSAGRRAVIAQALATPSYQNAIANGAYGAILQANDTSFIAAVDSSAGDAAEPAYVLAILGVRGNAHALDLVVNHLDDDRPAVRRWALEAIENILPPEVATARLRAVRDRLQHADSKAAVGRVLERLAPK
jgi:HEAT repeat protein